MGHVRDGSLLLSEAVDQLHMVLRLDVGAATGTVESELCQQMHDNEATQMQSQEDVLVLSHLQKLYIHCKADTGG